MKMELRVIVRMRGKIDMIITSVKYRLSVRERVRLKVKVQVREVRVGVE